jgi:AcrR family transcriptional regulator
MSKPSPRDLLAQAAFDLFDERGYDHATVDDITERAHLGRTTFLRYYRSKEDVIFPDHDRLLAQVRDRLLTSGHVTTLAAVADAVRLVLLHYLDEGDLARRRYALTSKVPALRDREIVSVARYQRLFREFITEQADDKGEPASLRAELMAAAVVAAHNHVLRRWLRGESPDPVGNRIAVGSPARCDSASRAESRLPVLTRSGRPWGLATGRPAAGRGNSRSAAAPTPRRSRNGPRPVWPARGRSTATTISCIAVSIPRWISSAADCTLVMTPDSRPPAALFAAWLQHLRPAPDDPRRKPSGYLTDRTGVGRFMLTNKKLTRYLCCGLTAVQI